MSNLPPLPEPAGWAPVLGSQNIFTAEQLLAFAEEAVRLEREACAKLCDAEKFEGYSPPEDGSAREYYNDAARNCADAIRARSQR